MKNEKTKRLRQIQTTSTTMAMRTPLKTHLQIIAKSHTLLSTFCLNIEGNRSTISYLFLILNIQQNNFGEKLMNLIFLTDLFDA